MSSLRTRQEKFVLVDFDNLTKKQKQKGLYSVLYRITEWLAPFCDPKVPYLIHFRLYGGWYEHRRPTRRAQDLLIEIAQKLSPTITIPLSGGSFFKASIRADLAYSLGANPHKHLFSTFRHRKGLGHLNSKSPKSKDCTKQFCPLDVVHQVIRNAACTESSCGKSVETYISKAEQKLVDSMLVTDLLYYACVRGEPTCLVSADDDMWPGIITATALGGKVFHVKPKPSGDSHKFYAPMQAKNYEQFIM